MTTYNNLINGQWVAGKTVTANTNPSDLSDVIGEYTQGDAADVNAAVAAAQAAFPAWSTSGIQARSDALDKIGNEILARKEELGDLLAVKKARPALKPLVKWHVQARSSSSLPVNACAWRARAFPRCDLALAWRSRASQLAWSV